MKKIMIALSVFTLMLNTCFGAVTETDEFIFTNTVTFTGKALGVDATDTNGLVNLQQLDRTYWITNVIPFTNTIDFAITGLAANKVTLHDVRMFLSLTNGSPVTKRASLSMCRNSNMRCNSVVYLDTNQLYYSTLTTVAGVAGTFSNIVADASGTVINDLYWKNIDGSGTNDYQRAATPTATAINWTCSNRFDSAAGTLISHVNQFGGFPYYDANTSSSIWFRLSFYTPYTGVVTTAINYGR